MHAYIDSKYKEKMNVHAVKLLGGEKIQHNS